MKKRLISVVLAILTVFLCFGFSGCVSNTPTFEEVVPLEYADWDGNYIYYQNARSKTTGEDFEVLVETVQIEETTYRIKSIEEVEYFEDLIVFCFYVEENVEIEEGAEEQELKVENCIVVYDVYNKTSKLIYVSKQDTLLAESIYKIDNDYIILYNELNWFKIDWEGNIVINYQANFNDYNTYKIYQRYYVIKSTCDKVYYTTLDDGEFKEIFDYEYAGIVPNTLIAPSTVFSEVQGRKGFLIKTIKVQKDYYESIRKMGAMAKKSYALHFYDLETGEISEFLNVSDDKHCSVQGDYLVVGEEYYIRWKEGKYEDDDIKAKNCELYRMDYVGDGKFQKTKLFSFDGEYAKMDFLAFKRTVKGNLKFFAKWIQSQEIRNCSGTVETGPQLETYVLDLSTMELKEYEENSGESSVWGEYSEDQVIVNDRVCGIYEYALYDVSYTTVDGRYGTAHKFVRYNTELDERKSETLQFWVSDEEDMIYEPTEYVTEDGETLVIPPFRYCEEMWLLENHYGGADFIVRSY